jgi:hypothetical protein
VQTTTFPPSTQTTRLRADGRNGDVSDDIQTTLELEAAGS